jgi:hypothetical protein
VEAPLGVVVAGSFYIPNHIHVQGELGTGWTYRTNTDDGSSVLKSDIAKFYLKFGFHYIGATLELGMSSYLTYPSPNPSLKPHPIQSHQAMCPTIISCFPHRVLLNCREGGDDNEPESLFIILKPSALKEFQNG